MYKKIVMTVFAVLITLLFIVGTVSASCDLCYPGPTTKPTVKPTPIPTQKPTPLPTMAPVYYQKQSYSYYPSSYDYSDEDSGYDSDALTFQELAAEIRETATFYENKRFGNGKNKIFIDVYQITSGKLHGKVYNVLKKNSISCLKCLGNQPFISAVYLEKVINAKSENDLENLMEDWPDQLRY